MGRPSDTELSEPPVLKRKKDYFKDRTRKQKDYILRPPVLPRVFYLKPSANNF